MRYYCGQYIAVNFKQIQEAFAEGLAIDFKYVEAFSQTVLYEFAPVGLIIANQEALRLVLMRSEMLWL